MKEIFYHNEHTVTLANQLESVQEEILESWQKDRVVEHVLLQKEIDPIFFVKFFGSKVLEYYLKVLRNEEMVGECPVMIVMVKFFSEKNLTLQDVFICCSGLKNSMSNIYLERFYEMDGRQNRHMLKILHLAFDLNFSGVIDEYIESGYCFVQCPQKEQITTVVVPKETFKNIETELKEAIQTKPLQDSEEYKFTEEEIQELGELEEEITYFNDILHTNAFSYQNSSDLSALLIKYANTISLNPSYRKMSASLYELAHLYSNQQNLEKIYTHLESLALLMDSFVNDLIAWRKSVKEPESTDPHYYDQSIISNAEQIVALLLSSEDDEEGCEFF